ncbi:MAG: hypothetical protein RL347_774, partial [Actinomycetota bacterium]
MQEGRLIMGTHLQHIGVARRTGDEVNPRRSHRRALASMCEPGRDVEVAVEHTEEIGTHQLKA